MVIVARVCRENQLGCMVDGSRQPSASQHQTDPAGARVAQNLAWTMEWSGQQGNWTIHGRVRLLVVSSREPIGTAPTPDRVVVRGPSRAFACEGSRTILSSGNWADGAGVVTIVGRGVGHEPLGVALYSLVFAVYVLPGSMPHNWFLALMPHRGKAAGVGQTLVGCASAATIAAVLTPARYIALHAYLALTLEAVAAGIDARVGHRQ